MHRFSTMIMLHPYGLLIFAIFYNFSLRGSITFCEYWNPINSIAEMLISTPGTDQPQSKIDEGIINYPQPLTTIADLLVSDPDPVLPESSASTHESTPLTTTPHALQGERLPLPLTPDDALTLRGIMGAPVNEYFCTSLRTSAMIHKDNRLAYGPLSNIFPPEDSLAFEPALSDSFDHNTFFNDYVDLIKDVNDIDNLRNISHDFVKQHIPPEYWSQNKQQFDDRNSPLYILSQNLSEIGDLTTKEKLAVKFLRITIRAHDNLQVTHLPDQAFTSLWYATSKNLT